jgi:hypothetical protein
MRGLTGPPLGLPPRVRATRRHDELTALIIESEDETLTLVRLYAP